MLAGPDHHGGLDDFAGRAFAVLLTGQQVVDQTRIAADVTSASPFPAAA